MLLTNQAPWLIGLTILDLTAITRSDMLHVHSCVVLGCCHVLTNKCSEQCKVGRDLQSQEIKNLGKLIT